MCQKRQRLKSISEGLTKRRHCFEYKAASSSVQNRAKRSKNGQTRSPQRIYTFPLVPDNVCAQRTNAQSADQRCCRARHQKTRSVLLRKRLGSCALNSMTPRLSHPAAGTPYKASLFSVEGVALTGAYRTPALLFTRLNLDAMRRFKRRI